MADRETKHLKKWPAAPTPYVPRQQQVPGDKRSMRETSGNGLVTCETLLKMGEKSLIMALRKGGHLDADQKNCFHCKKEKLGILKRRSNKGS
jgi:hypothetical protein